MLLGEGVITMAGLLQDLTGGLRFFRKRPVFTGVAVFTLALGIGATSQVYSVVSTVLFRPQPYPRPERLVMVWEDYVSHDQKHLIAAAEFANLKREARSLDQLSAVDLVSCSIARRDQPVHASGALVSSDFFPLLGAHAAIGRTFLDQEDSPGRGQEVVLSHRLWQGRFGADPHVVGQSLDVLLIRDFRAEAARTFTVVGVMPPDFEPPAPEMDVDLWVPIALTPGPDETIHHLLALGRLRAGFSLARAQAQVDALASHFATLGLVHQDHFRCNLVPLREFLAGDLRPALLVLVFAVGFVLLIACTNVANLMLAQASSRQAEMAIRAALGASRRQLIRRRLIESALLGLLGGATGLLLCYGSLQLLVALSPADFPRLHQIRVDSQVLGFACVVSVMTAVISGLAPALHGSGSGLSETLKGTGGHRFTAGRQARRLGSMLVVTEVALAVVLVIAAGLLARSFQHLVAVDPGFNPRQLLVLRISLPRGTAPASARRLAFLERCIEKIEALPGVRAAGVANLFPLRGWNTDTDFLVAGRAELTAANAPKADWRAVTTGYFRTLGIPLVQGRSFTEVEQQIGAPVAVVNQALAQRFWPGESAIGKRLKQLVTGIDLPWLSVIGVVGDVRNVSLGNAATPAIYTQTYWFPTVSLGVRTAGEPAALADPVRRVIWGLDKDVAIEDVSRMGDVVRESTAQPRFSAAIFGGFALLALILAAVGIYGVLAFAAGQRAKEIGLRLALGASRRQVLKLVVALGMTPVLAGLLLGLVVAAGLTRFLSSLLFGIGATDPFTFCAGPAVLVCVALAACLLPAWRAARIDPASSFNS
jgi:putative ABC transport system permease protein